MYEPKVGDSVEFPSINLKGSIYAVHDGFFRVKTTEGNDAVYTERNHKLSVSKGIKQHDYHNVSVKVLTQ